MVITCLNTFFKKFPSTTKIPLNKKAKKSVTAEGIRDSLRSGKKKCRCGGNFYQIFPQHNSLFLIRLDFSLFFSGIRPFFVKFYFIPSNKNSLFLIRDALNKGWVKVRVKKCKKVKKIKDSMKFPAFFKKRYLLKKIF